MPIRSTEFWSYQKWFILTYWMSAEIVHVEVGLQLADRFGHFGIIFWTGMKILKLFGMKIQSSPAEVDDSEQTKICEKTKLGGKDIS